MNAGSYESKEDDALILLNTTTSKPLITEKKLDNEQNLANLNGKCKFKADSLPVCVGGES